MTAPVRQTALAWLRDDALPLWHRLGWDAKSGGFVERLTADGLPDLEAPRRVRVQMRQIYVYASAAHERLYDPAEKLALDTLDFLLTRCRPKGATAGFAHLTDSRGQVTDAKIDAYDQAFALLALAAVYRMNGDAQVRALIDAELSFIDAQIAETATGLWLEGVPTSLPRRQNPQMHAFEAFLALYEATDDADYLKRADVIAEHLEHRMISPGGAICEFFDAGFAPLADGQCAEPGHHFEWVWLLHRHARLARRSPPALANMLMDWGLKHGIGADGFAIDACEIDGAVKDGGRRLWPQTELIKAHLARSEAGIEGAGDVADAALQALMTAYFSERTRGGWVDRYDALGALSDARMPVSTFYHVYVAICEAARVGGLNR